MTLNDLPLHWIELGKGPPLLLLHGLGDSHRTWSRVSRPLSRSRRVLMPDLAGHGLSGRPDASYTLEWHADVICSWLAALHINEVDLVGHSYGGGVAQQMLMGRGVSVRRLVLVGAGGLGREAPLSLRLAALPYFLENLGQPFMSCGTRIAHRLTGGAYPAAEIGLLALMNATPGTARAFARSVRDVIGWRGQRRGFLGRSAATRGLPPIGLFWGECDPILPFAHALEAAEQINGAELTRFAACGHFPQLEQPEQFANALEAFLDLPHTRQQ